MIDRITIITLGVADLPRARRFYVDGLGLPPHASSNDDIVFLELPGTRLALYPWEKLAEDALVDPSGGGFRRVTLAHNVGSRAAVDAVLAQAVQAGAELKKPAQDVFWGGYSGYFADPDGHLWEVAFNPFMNSAEESAEETAP